MQGGGSMISIRLIFEMLPIFLAIPAIFMCGYKVLMMRRNHDRTKYILMVVCSVLLVVAQSSWTFTVLKGLTDGTDIANLVWTLFNSLVMLTFIFSTKRIK